MGPRRLRAGLAQRTATPAENMEAALDQIVDAMLLRAPNAQKFTKQQIADYDHETLRDMKAAAAVRKGPHGSRRPKRRRASPPSRKNASRAGTWRLERAAPLMSEPVSRFYTSQGLRLHWSDWGNASAPPLLLLHGGRDQCRAGTSSRRACATNIM